MADLAEIKAGAAKHEEVVDIQFFDEDGEPYLAPDGTPCTIGFIGQDSENYKRRKKALARRKGRTDADDLALTALVAGAVRWHGWTWHGEPIECTPDNVREVLGSRKHMENQAWPGILRTRDEASDDMGFSGTASKTSAPLSATAHD